MRIGNLIGKGITAALNLSIGDFSAGFNLFTGRRNKGDQRDENIEIGVNSRDSNKVFHKNSFVNEQGPKYRLGALTFGYKGYRVGVNSEHVRHAIQNQAIHNLNLLGIIDKRQPGFRNQSWDWKPYFQYQSHNPYTLW